MNRKTLLIRTVLLSIISWSGVPNALSFSERESRVDRDGDELDDGFEMEILEKFIPTFMISESECAGLPAEFRPGSLKPEPHWINGTLYGQVFPVVPPGTSASYLEVHYYTLWSHDCGSFGHRLDAEYVSVLIGADSPAQPAENWRAVYWFAAAHEGTPCDASNGALASAIDAEEEGAIVWVSEGKHASFLSLELCQKLGCGGDRCENMQPMPRGKLINLGEPGALMNGAVWVKSESWPLSTKMETDFGDAGLLRFDQLDGDNPVFVHTTVPPSKALLLAGNRTLNSLDITGSEVDGALKTTGEHTERSLALALEKAGRSVGKSVKVLGRWLGITR